MSGCRAWKSASLGISHSTAKLLTTPGSGRLRAILQPGDLVLQLAKAPQHHGPEPVTLIRQRQALGRRRNKATPSRFQLADLLADRRRRDASSSAARAKLR